MTYGFHFMTYEIHFMTEPTQVIPNLVFLLQNKLHLSSHQLVIVLNLSMHWWKKSDLPFVGPSTMAKRMGTSRRTVERQLKALCDMGLVQKKCLDSCVMKQLDRMHALPLIVASVFLNASGSAGMRMKEAQSYDLDRSLLGD